MYVVFTSSICDLLVLCDWCIDKHINEFMIIIVII